MYAQVFIVKSMIIQLTSSWMSSLPVKEWEIMKVTVDFKVFLFRSTMLLTTCSCLVCIITRNVNLYCIDFSDRWAD